MCVCVCERVCVIVCFECREKKISRSATPVLENVLVRQRHLPPGISRFSRDFPRMDDGQWAKRFGDGGARIRTRTNDQAYTDDEQKHWFDKNDYRWLRERGVCTRPALGIYIETNPISHYVLDLSLPVNSQFMLVISRCIYILLNPRKKRPVTKKFYNKNDQ